MPDSIIQQRTLICFDYGKKRIGVAVGQNLTYTASALETITSKNGKPDWDAIARIVKQWQPQAFVLGLPLNDDGTDHQITKAVRQFSNQLQDRHPFPVYHIDERLSSVEAEKLVKKKRKLSRNKGEIDKLAARIILQSWLDNPENR
ncbi:MAG: Holliday junction resolvase RuvX [Gammaproteobacteria bacterium]|nr:Holliday junction resolvase RuvX [Gammaproteobacteria bacterium]